MFGPTPPCTPILPPPAPMWTSMPIPKVYRIEKGGITVEAPTMEEAVELMRKADELAKANQ